ncbi:ATP-dependent proteinase, Serine peptidase, MEROPS family S16 [Desulforamulus reducens MI-1]|uniref:Lon protease n=1 Tax=Desulforamulus reducens (strain ATCC BAA-1160 / DSM 100696 / MI-1) TaxID=349161 RepID=LON_DESRM|nr:endopeptidase La [Desulforamulus reducens]A4J7L6.1 RecName: Full=Lon protease; AltName: Full=ATP-dependent protease La [Desulforamulus reducens MI-1]ABO51069.1 ATP-dependent proteinase, Serine peptidase, MEROPS family S16 [Desulforamulus reducens MI-1]
MNSEIKSLPLLPLRGILVFPYMVIHLDVGREKSIQAIEEAMVQDRMIFLATQREAQTDEPTVDDIYNIGTVAEVKQLLKLPGGTIRVLVEGIARAKIEKYEHQDPYFRVEVQQYSEEFEKGAEVEALMRSLVYQFEQYVKLSKRIPPETVVSVVNLEEPGRLADIIASHLALKIEDKQNVLESVEIVDRLEKLCGIVAKELEIVELERKINIRVRKQMEKTQKEYYLREQMKAIQKELGEKDERVAECEEFREKISKAKFPKEAEEKALKEVERLEKMPPMAAEAAVVRNYLDWMLSLPWSKSTKDRIDINAAEEVLEADHYGLKDPKERITEYLAIRKLAKKMKGPILCLVGPPGVGKTSLGRSVARALDRKFVRISLGGVRDEAEIRGHRRTYVGAMPGRVIQGMRTAGSKNPVFLLDEIDKMASDFRGDPSSALLEVLDPEQNSTFSDHYIETPFDLSNVMFITTANNMYSIPRPLLDRMEVIQISGYTEEEKLQIAKRHLMPKQIKDHGLTEEMIQISENTILKVIREYTRESGVRNLERKIASICRKTAKKIVAGQAEKVKVTTQNLEQFLGIPRYRYGVAEQNDEVGTVTGMAWTEVGGDTLVIEVTTYKGTGRMTLTGKLGDVMKESAQAGYSFIRSRAQELGIDQEMFEKWDLHIHIPEGAIPKDGPSAGITMATAMASVLTGRKVRHDIAMTGEITLRGRVLPVGGIKEKVMAAHRAGIKLIILPNDNKKDLEDIPVNIKKQLEFKLVDHIDQVLAIALLEKEVVDTTTVLEPEAAVMDNPHFSAVDSQEVQQQGGTQLPS